MDAILNVLTPLIFKNIPSLTNEQKDNFKEKLKSMENLYTEIQKYMAIHTKNGFDMEAFIVLLKPAVEFIDRQNAPFYYKIIQSVMALVQGNVDGVQQEFFIMININPNDIDDIKRLLKEFKNLLSNSDDFVNKMTQMG